MLLLNFSPQASISLFHVGQTLPSWVVAFFAVVLFWLLLLLVGFLNLRSGIAFRVIIFRYAAAILTSVGINTAIEWFFFRTRPFVAFGFEPLINVSIYSGSFPSDHAVMSFAVAVFAALQTKKNSVLLLILAFFISLARVFAGVHYLSDVAVGACVGVFVGAAMNYYFVRASGTWLARLRRRFFN